MRNYATLFIMILILVKIGDVALVHFHEHPDYGREDTFFVFDLYPYTGYHVPANEKFVRQDANPILDFENLEVRSGPLGFFTGFPIDRPPKKKANEFRLILTGGSTAQGFGVSRNELMFYSVLEKRINAKLEEIGSQKRLTVINLAMGASNGFHNFVTLNLWGHPLEPDAIPSLSGMNDFESDSPMFSGGYQLGGFVLSQRRSRDGWIMKAFSFVLPGIFNHSIVGQALRSVRLARESQNYRDSYVGGGDVAQMKVKFFVRALSSITRDFPGVPVLFVTQPAGDRPDAERFFDETEMQLQEQVASGRIRILDAFGHWKRNGNFPGSFVDGHHFTEKGNELMTAFVFDQVMEMILKERKIERGRYQRR